MPMPPRPDHETWYTECSYPECTERIEEHCWGHVKSGWFFQRNGTQWCPAHTPEWVDEWREKKKKRVT